jgi:hypothetical protein
MESCPVDLHGYPAGKLTFNVSPSHADELVFTLAVFVTDALLGVDILYERRIALR